MNTSRIICAAGLVLATAANAAAQSLADVARKEEERRKAVGNPSKVYTADDLKKFGGIQVPPPAPAVPASGAAAAAAPPAEPGKPDAPAAAGAAPVAAPEPEKDEAYWRKAFGEVRSKLETRRAMLQAVDQRVVALATNAALVEPSQRPAIEQERARLVAEADKLRQEVAELTRELGALEDEARRTNVPGGWIR